MPSIQIQDRIFEDIRAIIFDKDGTLEDSEDVLRQLGQVRSRRIDAQIPGIGDPLLMAFGIGGDTLDPTGLMAVGTRQENEIAAAAYIAETGRGWIESREIARRAFEEADEPFKNRSPSPLFVGSLEVLKSLSEARLKLGILSSASTEQVRAFVSHHQLDNYFGFVQGAHSHLSKPDPVLFLQACQTLGVEASATLMVGDSAADIEMAKNAGAAGCIGICWRRQSADHLHAADVVISQIDAIQIVNERQLN
ncbi:HAD family hydrolase [Lyngbya sp. CCY1209]|uniref:HAD family hydrolase n=1 Tax=Lyngbya sp. CCY1209 TaxID=2886103 RepID=UPI002D216BB3|nr:HAD family hydrolase [Lyngbya sp. CCY1209]MEB3887485.1 HAD family hydrolase [Lyngbya sp. CCY1209]